MVTQLNTIKRVAARGSVASPRDLRVARGLQRRPALLDSAHVGDIHGALGTVRQHDVAPRRSWRALRAYLLLAAALLVVKIVALALGQ